MAKTQVEWLREAHMTLIGGMLVGAVPVSPPSDEALRAIHEAIADSEAAILAALEEIETRVMKRLDYIEEILKRSTQCVEYALQIEKQSEPQQVWPPPLSSPFWGAPSPKSE